MSDFSLYNMATPAVAMSFVLFSSKGCRAISVFLMLYFGLSSLLVFTLDHFSILYQMGSAYFFVYCVFSVLFVTLFCAIVALDVSLKQKKRSWAVAVVMYLIVGINAGVYFEPTPAIWGIYESAMLSLECTLLGIGAWSSGILDGLFGLFTRWRLNSRSRNGVGAVHDIRGGSAYERYNEVKSG